MIQKRIAARILKCSPKRIIFDDSALSEIKEAITREDMRGLIHRGLVRKVQVQGISSSRVRRRQKRGAGSKKGKQTARQAGKQSWENRIRLQRKFLKKLSGKKEISHETYRMLYVKAKGGFFRSLRHLALYMTEHGMRKK